MRRGPSEVSVLGMQCGLVNLPALSALALAGIRAQALAKAVLTISRRPSTPAAVASGWKALTGCMTAAVGA